MIDAVRGFAERRAHLRGVRRPDVSERGIGTLDGPTWPMVGLIAGDAVMHDRLQAIGYVEVETRGDSILGPAGVRFRGHQFRYSTLTPNPDRIERVYAVRPKWGEQFAEGYRAGNLLASYVHAHWASNPDAAADSWSRAPPAQAHRRDALRSRRCAS